MGLENFAEKYDLKSGMTWQIWPIERREMKKKGEDWASIITNICDFTLFKLEFNASALQTNVCWLISDNNWIHSLFDHPHTSTNYKPGACHARLTLTLNFSQFKTSSGHFSFLFCLIPRYRIVWYVGVFHTCWCRLYVYCLLPPPFRFFISSVYAQNVGVIILEENWHHIQKKAKNLGPIAF